MFYVSVIIHFYVYVNLATRQEEFTVLLCEVNVHDMHTTQKRGRDLQ